MDREILFKQAKKLMLKDKEHGPIVFAETKDQNYWAIRHSSGRISGILTHLDA